MCGILAFCGSPSKLCSPAEPKKPRAASTSWQPLHSSTVSVTGVKKRVLPAAFAVLSELSRLRTGFGGRNTWRMKSVNCCICVGVTVPCFPTRPSKATMKFRNDRSSSQGPSGGGLLHASVPKKPSTRSPRQCIPPWVPSPRSVCVVIGPFIGWKVAAGGSTDDDGCVLLDVASSGLPRSQARLSKSPKTWQLEQEASPLPEE